MTRHGYMWFAGLAGAVALIALVIWLLLSYLYAESENRNFERLRRKSELDCSTMPLHCAVRDGDFDAVVDYFARGGDPELKDNWGQSALFWAVQQGKDAMVTALLSAGADPDTRDETGVSVFYRAVAVLKYDVADALLEAGADVNAMNSEQHPETTLHYCVMQNRKDCVEFLLLRGADRTLEDSFGYTPLERTQLHDHIDDEIGDLLRE